MISYLLDTNPLLRYLINDIPTQAAQTQLIFQKAARLEAKVYIPIVVLTEVVFTLTKAYGWPKNQVVDTLLAFATSPSLDIENRPVTVEALNLFKDHSLGFVDCLLTAIAKNTGKTIFTFDTKLSRLKTS